MIMTRLAGYRIRLTVHSLFTFSFYACPIIWSTGDFGLSYPTKVFPKVE
jgi:hypothetical protein